MITFHVAALPVPKGSVRAFMPKGWTRPVLTSDAKGLKAWAAVVRAEAQRHVGALILEGVSMRLDFALVRPASLPKRVRHHLKKPDVDKLARGVLDALTGIAFRDDSQVVTLLCSKRYVVGAEQPGVTVSMFDVTDTSSGNPQEA